MLGNQKTSKMRGDLRSFQFNNIIGQNEAIKDTINFSSETPRYDLMMRGASKKNQLLL
jgi:hypothetical protein